MKSQSHEIGSFDYCITIKFDRHISSAAAEEPVKFWSDCTILSSNFMDSRLLGSYNKKPYVTLKQGPGGLESPEHPSIYIKCIYSMAIFRFMSIQYATFVWQCYLEPSCLTYKTLYVYIFYKKYSLECKPKHKQISNNFFCDAFWDIWCKAELSNTWIFLIVKTILGIRHQHKYYYGQFSAKS